MIYVIVHFKDFIADKQGSYKHLVNKEVSRSYSEKIRTIGKAEHRAQEAAHTLRMEYAESLQTPVGHVLNLFEVRELEHEDSQDYRVIFQSVEMKTSEISHKIMIYDESTSTVVG